jgi:hypothetical protein
LRVRKATYSDFDAVYTLLRRLNDTTFSKEDWQQICRLDFQSSLSHFGYVLENDQRIVGFMGTIFSERIIKGKAVKFCNFHSWIVDPRAKSHGMALLLEVMKLKDHVITNFTASAGPYKIFKALRFNEIEYTNYKLLPFQIGPLVHKTVRSINNSNAGKLLNEEELAIFRHHRKFTNVQFLWVGDQQGHSFIVAKKKHYIPVVVSKIPVLSNFLSRSLKLAQLHYLSDPEHFFTCYASLQGAARICLKLGSIGVITEDRFLPAKQQLRKKRYPAKRPYFYKNANDDGMIDTLYSELFVLNL